MLRAQYEKEGELVGVQTKFNYAWVSQAAPSEPIPPPTHSRSVWRRNQIY